MFENILNAIAAFATSVVLTLSGVFGVQAPQAQTQYSAVEVAPESTPQVLAEETEATPSATPSPKPTPRPTPRPTATPTPTPSLVSCQKLLDDKKATIKELRKPIDELRAKKSELIKEYKLLNVCGKMDTEACPLDPLPKSARIKEIRNLFSEIDKQIADLQAKINTELGNRDILEWVYLIMRDGKCAQTETLHLN